MYDNDKNVREGNITDTLVKKDTQLLLLLLLVAPNSTADR